MSDIDPSMERIVPALKASLAPPATAADVRHTNVERLLHLMMEEFSESHPAARIRVLPDTRRAGDWHAGFLLQIDDYDVRLLLTDAPSGARSLDAPRLPAFLKLLEDNPNTVALVLVWNSAELAAVPLSPVRIRYLCQNPSRLPDLLTSARPLSETLRDLVSRQTRLWQINLRRVVPTEAKSIDMRQIFEGVIGAALEAERGRPYRRFERKRAAEQFPVEEEKRVIFAVFGEALAGAPASELVRRLVPGGRRGGR